MRRESSGGRTYRANRTKSLHFIVISCQSSFQLPVPLAKES